MSDNLLLRNARDRAEYGVTTTWETQGRTLTVYRGGAPRKALLAIVEDVLAIDPTFRLIAYSTPETIFGDLQGHMPVLHRSGYHVRKAPPELVALAGIKRQDLVHHTLKDGARRSFS